MQPRKQRIFHFPSVSQCLCLPVFLIRVVLMLLQICTVPLVYRSGSRCQQIKFFSNFFPLITYCRYIYSSKIKIKVFHETGLRIRTRTNHFFEAGSGSALKWKLDPDLRWSEKINLDPHYSDADPQHWHLLVLGRIRIQEAQKHTDPEHWCFQLRTHHIIRLLWLEGQKSRQQSSSVSARPLQKPSWLKHNKAVLGIRDILVRIRIPGSVPLTNGSGSNSGSGSFLHWFWGCQKIFVSYFFLITCPQANHLQT